MLLKNIDDKNEQFQQLEYLYKSSNSESQKKLIKEDLNRIKKGFETEKDNAYYLNFYLKDSENTIVLHDLRLEHNGLTAQIDHLLINRLEIVVLESKSFAGTLEIKNDNSMEVSSSNGHITSYPNPLEQCKRHTQLLKSLLREAGYEKNTFFKNIPFKSYVLVNPKTVIKNKTLPTGFIKSDNFISFWRGNKDSANFIKSLNLVLGMKNRDSIKEIAEFLFSQHKPISFDYSIKYKTPEKENVTAKENAPILDSLKILNDIKNYRKSISQKKKIKPYMVFSDKTLDEIINKKPSNKAELLLINGFGSVKVNEYGDEILKILCQK
jgi:superfamily II DNA helicase RecQ